MENESLISWNRYLYCRNDPINYIDPDGLMTWPYTWKGWLGCLAGGAGLLLSATPLAPVGYGLMIGGGCLLLLDLAEGFLGEDGAFKIGRGLSAQLDVRQRIAKVEESRQWTLQEAQELELLPTKEELLGLNFTVQDLIDLGFITPDQNNEDNSALEIIVPENEPRQGV